MHLAIALGSMVLMETLLSFCSQLTFDSFKHHNDYRKLVPPSKLIQASQTFSDRPGLTNIIPAIAMFDASSIPEWSRADSSLTEYAMIHRARETRQGKVDKESTKQEVGTSPAQTSLNFSSYPLAMTALGNGTARPRSRFNGIGGTASKIVCLLIIIGILLDPWQQHHTRRQDLMASNVLVPMRATMPPTTQHLVANKSRGFFQKPAFLPKAPKPTSAMDFALSPNPAPSFTVVVLPQAQRAHQHSTGWKNSVRGAPRHVWNVLERYVITPLAPKIDSSLYSNAAGVPAHYFLSQELFC